MTCPFYLFILFLPHLSSFAVLYKKGHNGTHLVIEMEDVLLILDDFMSSPGVRGGGVEFESLRGSYENLII